MDKRVRYPENLGLKVEIVKSGLTVTDLANKIGISRLILSKTINGHYKGINVVPKVKEELGIK